MLNPSFGCVPVLLLVFVYEGGNAGQIQLVSDIISLNYFFLYFKFSIVCSNLVLQVLNVPVTEVSVFSTCVVEAQLFVQLLVVIVRVNCFFNL